VFPDERGVHTDALLDRIAASRPVVPGHWILEVTNGLLLAARRGRLRRDEDLEIMERLAQLGVRVDEETWDRGWRETLFLARRFALTTYDAAYLELAARLDAPLATADLALARAARAADVAVIGPDES
jgi:predicted nucleic acid-binding protein